MSLIFSRESVSMATKTFVRSIDKTVTTGLPSTSSGYVPTFEQIVETLSHSLKIEHFSLHIPVHLSRYRAEHLLVDG